MMTRKRGLARLKLLFVAVTRDKAFFEPVKRSIADAAAFAPVLALNINGYSACPPAR